MRDELILDNLNLIYFVIKQLGLYHNCDYYYGIGLMGLIKAADRFNPDLGIAFNTYAVPIIRNDILYDIRRNNSDKRKANQGTISLDTVIMSDSVDITLGDVIPDKFDLEQYIIEKEKMELVREAISTLTMHEQSILMLYYFEDMKQKDLAKILNMGQTSVCRKLKKIIEKIQKIIKY